MISDDGNRGEGTRKPVTEFPERCNYGKHFFVMHIIINLGRFKLSGEKGDRMKFSIVYRLFTWESGAHM